VALRDLVSLVEENGRHFLLSRPPTNIEPMLRNWRTAVVLMEDSPFTWKLSAVGRLWNDTRSDATQHLQLTSTPDDFNVDATFRLTKLTITPAQSTIQTAVLLGEKQLSVMVVLDRNFTELAVSDLGQAKASVILRAPAARDMLRSHPIQTRQYLIPVLRLVNNGKNPLQPAAGDVYRAFPGLGPDEATVATVRALVPDLANADPAIRERGSRELASLGRRGVQAAMSIPPDGLPYEAADRLADLVARNTLDPRTPEQLRADASFLADCLIDSDPAVVKAAGDAVMKLK
ncbi:MAG TPA: hypothetical protein VGB55_11135, partial [Tepidisphaeraceae bacterium]|jgi:hypothetical protein